MATKKRAAKKAAAPELDEELAPESAPVRGSLPEDLSDAQLAGGRGVFVDPEPNESYTVAGVLAKAKE